MSTMEEELAILKDRLDRYIVLIYHTRVFIDNQYFSLGKRTIPLHAEMEHQFELITPADKAYNKTVLDQVIAKEDRR